MAQRLGIGEEDFLKHASRLDDHWQTGHVDSYQDCLMALCRTAGHTPNGPAIAELARERSMRTSVLFEEIEPAIVELVQELGVRGFRLAVITTTLRIWMWSHGLVVDLLHSSRCSFRHLRLECSNPTLAFTSKSCRLWA